MSERIAIDALVPGMVIVRVTQQNGPVTIRKSGLVTSHAMIQGLAEMGVQEVEIDPEQTVEIDAPVATHRTQTQALLRGQHDTVARIDNSMSEQFNRSLFLPTVQGLPSLWQVYLKQSLMFGVVIAGGFALGFTAATYSTWWPMLVATQTTETATTPVQTTSTQPMATVQTQQAQSPSIEVAQKPVDDALAGSEEPLVETPQAEPLQATAAPEQALTRAEGEVDYGGEVLNDEPTQSNVEVSPELLQRFNQAVAELDSNRSQSDAQEKPRVVVRNDVQRVDQLPVRMLTQLPSMSFSAHMYASNPSDRWVRVNGRQMGEGDWINDEVQIVNIEAQRVILQFRDEVFSMAALTDW